MIVAWIWSIIFYLGLDPIKWAMAYAMNEDGFRTRTLNRRRQQPPPEVRPCMRQRYSGVGVKTCLLSVHIYMLQHLCRRWCS